MNTHMKITAAFMSVVLLTAGLLTGCKLVSESKGDDGTLAESSSVKGRYVEEDISLPIQEGEDIIGMNASVDGNPIIFSRTNDDIIRWEYQSGEWVQSNLEWIETVYKDMDVYLGVVWETQDGVQLVLGQDEELKTYLARSQDGQTGEILDIPYFEQKGEGGYPYIFSMQVDEAGNYWLQDMYQSKYVVISPDTLDVIKEFNLMEMGQGLAFCGKDGMTALCTESGTYTIYDKDMTEQGMLSVDTSGSHVLCSDGESWYMISEDGITRMQPGNDIREVIMDGSLGAMGLPSNYISNAVMGQGTDFYVLYSQMQTGIQSLAHYIYDENVAAVPKHTLQVFGFSQSDTVRQAIIGFQKQYPEVKIEFQTSDKSEEEITSDDIRALNTELLGGNGADILLLDGLPTESYIEKGILCDLTDLVDSITDSGDYMDSIIRNTAQKDGKIYGLPVKFSIPVIYGDEEVKEALKSLDSLKAYMNDHPEATVFGVASLEYIRDFLFQMYQDEILTDDQTVNQEKLTDLLEIAGKIAVNAKASEVSHNTNFNTMSAGAEFGGWAESDAFSNPVAVSILNHPDAVGTEEISSVDAMLMPCAIMREMKVTPDSIKDYYIPKGIVGINKNTSQQSYAEEFIKYLLSKEIQSARLNDGLPVLNSALWAQADSTESEYAMSLMAGVSSMDIAGEKEVELQSGYPSREEAESIIKLCERLKCPTVSDHIIWGIYQKEMDQYLEGSINAEEAAASIVQKVDRYLAE